MDSRARAADNRFVKPPLISILLAAAFAAPVDAHGTVCAANNDTTAASSGARTPQPTGATARNVHAWQFIPNRAIFPRAALLFTGSANGDDYMRLEIWSDAGGAPGTALLGGTMATPRSATASWRGTNFASTGFLSRFTPYWLVWVEAGDSFMPEEPGGQQIPYRQLAADGSWTPMAMSPAKLRVFCGDTLDSPEVLRIGVGCATAGGAVPSAWSNELPTVGNADFAIEGVHLPPGARCWLLIGFDPTFTQLSLEQLLGAPFGCFLHTEVRASRQGMSGTAGIGSGAPGARQAPAGHVRYPLPLPPDPGLAGLVVTLQIAATDLAAAVALPLITTNSLQLTLQ